MSRLDRIEEKIDEMEKVISDKKKRKDLRFIKRIQRLGKKADKKIDNVLVQYLTQKYQVRFMVAKIIGGNCIVVNNKVHKLNPKNTWRHKKQLWYIVREIDRLPISNTDYDKVKARKDDTEADVPLIKAVLGAVQKKSKGIESRNLWIIIIIAVIALVVFFTFFRG